MAEPLRRPAGWEDLLATPENVQAEVIGGELEASEGRWVRLGAWTDGDQAAIPPFEAVPLDVGSLFPPERPDVPAGASGSG